MIHNTLSVDFIQLNLFPQLNLFLFVSFDLTFSFFFFSVLFSVFSVYKSDAILNPQQCSIAIPLLPLILISLSRDDDGDYSSRQRTQITHNIRLQILLSLARLCICTCTYIHIFIRSVLHCQVAEKIRFIGIVNGIEPVVLHICFTPFVFFFSISYLNYLFFLRIHLFTFFIFLIKSLAI